jgi:hypothetical protein
MSLPAVVQTLEARTRRIFDLVLDRKRVCTHMELAQTAPEREELMVEFKALTRAIEELQG